MSEQSTHAEQPPLAGRPGSATCPWCGGSAHLHEWYFGAFVVCWKCKAQGPPTSDTGTREGNAARAWELWEKRVESPNASPSATEAPHG